MGVDGLDFNAPVTTAHLSGLLAKLGLDQHGTALDVGCGRGESLQLLVEAAGCSGVGVDPDAAEIAIAQRRTPSRGRLAWHCARIDEAPLQPPFDAVVCVGASHAFGGPGEALPKTLSELANLVREGGRVLIGEGYWKRGPPREYLEATGMSADDERSHEANGALGDAFGWTLLHAETSSLEEWDHFESGHLRAAEASAKRATSDDTQAHEKLEHWRNWNTAYRLWGRDTLGFGFYVWELTRPCSP